MDDIYSSSNRINRVGDQLEYFVKDLFCDTFDTPKKDDKEREYANYFSWDGNKNNPPDFMIAQGDSFEVKKLTSTYGQIQLNSSYPHQKLYSDDSRITNDCRDCESSRGGWEEKDLVYVIGRVPRGSKEVDFIWLVYGDCWAAPRDVYERLASKVSDKINEGVTDLDHGELSEDTNELGRINRVDPLGRTLLRMRGMWIMKHPASYYKDKVPEYNNIIDGGSPLISVIRKSKFESFSNNDRELLENSDEIQIFDIDAPDPGNPANRIDIKLIVTGG